MRAWPLAAVGLAIAAACAPSQGGLLERGNEAFGRGDYEGATGAYQRAAVEGPDSPEPYYNAGNSLHRQHRNGDAARHLEQALRTAEPELGADAAFSLGNAHFREGDYEAAAGAYRRSLRLDPWAEDAKHNLELALARLDEERREEERSESGPQPTPAPTPQPGETPQDSGSGEPEEGGGGEEADSDPAGQDEPLTAEQARRLLEALAEDAGTLDQRLRTAAGVPVRPDQDW